MSDKPAVLVTRKLPDAVEDRLRRDYAPRLNPQDRLYSSDELVDLAKGTFAILPCHTERLSAEVIRRLPDDLRAIVNFSVGVDHVDLAAAKARGLVVTNTPDVEQGAVFHDRLEDLLAESQFLSLHCPATPESRGLLNAERIALLPDGAIVVNTARGAIVDDEALIAALKSGKLAAAGLDVYNNEPDIHPGYRELWNAFLLPHIGSATAETRDAMGFRALDNLDAILAGREPRDRVA